MPTILFGTITYEESVANIISSIAAQEPAIAQFLNAEANDLMAINCSVNATLDVVICLEMILKAKLELLQDTICQTE